MDNGTALKPKPGSDNPEHQPVYDDNLESMSGNVLSPEQEAARQKAMKERASLKEQEQGQAENAGTSNQTKGEAAENISDSEQQANDTVGSGYKKEAPKKRRFRGRINRRNALLGGGIATVIILIIVFATGFSAFELINLRENLLGNKNSHTNSILARRRAKNFANILHRLNTGTFEQNINKEDLRKKFKQNGFTLEFDEKTGKLTTFGYGNLNEPDRFLSFDLSAKDLETETTRFFGGGPGTAELSREASKAYDRVLNLRTGLWAGIYTKLMYKNILKMVFFAWPNRKPSDEAKTTREKIRDVVRHSDDASAIEVKGGKSASDLAKDNATKGPDGKDVPANVLDGVDILKGIENNGVGIDAYAGLKDNPKATPTSLGVTGTPADVADFANAIDSAGKAGLDASSVIGIGKKFLGKLPGNLLGSVAKGFSVVGELQTACTVKGVLNFVANVRNVLLTLELARFAGKWLSAADNQKAGILTASGLALVMIYLHTPSPGGGNYWSRITSGKATAAEHAMYDTGRGQGGVFNFINNFVSSIISGKSCKVVNNGFVTVAGFAIGIIASIATGGGFPAAQLVIGLALAIMQQAAISIATPLLISAGAHLVFAGDETSTMIGVGILSGFGAFAAMSGSANGLRPVTKKQLAAIEPLVEQDRQYALANQSLYDRYINPENGTSLLARIGMSMPTGFASLRTSIAASGLGALNRMTNFGVLNFLMPGTATASAADTFDADQSCKDPQVIANDIATDNFCNPIMAQTPNIDLTANEKVLRDHGLIDAHVNPTATAPPGALSFADYVKDCFVGRPGVLYTSNPSQEGEDDPIDNNCITAGPPLAGDTVGLYDRYSAMWGYIVDRDTELDQLGLTATP